MDEHGSERHGSLLGPSGAPLSHLEFSNTLVQKHTCNRQGEVILKSVQLNNDIWSFGAPQEGFETTERSVLLSVFIRGRSLLVGA